MSAPAATVEHRERPSDGVRTPCGCDGGSLTTFRYDNNRRAQREVAVSRRCGGCGFEMTATALDELDRWWCFTLEEIFAGKHLA